MKIATGRVIDGKVVLDGEPLAEGSLVTVVAMDGGEGFDVAPEDERALLAAIAEADRNDVVPWDEIRMRRPKTQ